MTRRIWSRVFGSLVVTLTIIVGPLFAEIPSGVSPGTVDRIAEIEGRCPTFSWEAVPGAAFFELVVYRLPGEPEDAPVFDFDLSETDEVLYERVPGGATTWTPAFAEGLEPGRSYVWYVRAVFREAQGEVRRKGATFTIAPLLRCHEQGVETAHPLHE